MKSDKTFEVLVKKFQEGLEELGLYEDKRALEVMIRITSALGKQMHLTPANLADMVETELKSFYVEEKGNILTRVGNVGKAN